MTGSAPTLCPDNLVFLGDSAATRALKVHIDGAARTQAKVLITGETGVGKEVVARMIHAQGARRMRPLVALNCSGVPETLLESQIFGHVRGSFTGAHQDHPGLVRQADRGTLFLDELGEMSPRMQAVLLRFVEVGEIQPVGARMATGRADVRLIAATNRDLRAQVVAGSFREDLYYRLNVIQIKIPPLRERREDILPLFQHFLRLSSEAHHLPRPTLTFEATERLERYAWPGNVRELKNAAERLVVNHPGERITPDELPEEFREDSRELRAGRPGSDLGAPAVEARGAAGQSVADDLWNQLMSGGDFWSVVYEQFKTHDVTRADVRRVIERGLQQTHGSYRAVLKLFHLPPSDYKRFLAFLYHNQCNLPFRPHREAEQPQPPLPQPTWHEDVHAAAS
jgi:DNA-binding NtrC family response regulator